MTFKSIIGATCACLALVSINAGAATVQLANGIGWPAPGGNSYSSTGNSGRDNGLEGVGSTISYSGFDNTQYNSLYYVVGDWPSGAWDPSGPRLGYNLDLLTYNAGTSNFGGGIVQWTGATTINLASGGSATYNARFTLSIGGASFVDASSISGMPASVGAAYEVTGDFVANWLYEIETSTGVWEPALDGYDALSTPIDDPEFKLSSGGAFYYTVVPVPAAVWLFGSGLIGLVGLARRKKV